MYIIKQGGRTDYNYKEFFCDVATDFQNISERDLKESCPGSVAYIISTGELFMLNSEKEWVEQVSGGGEGGSHPQKLQNKEVTITENTTTNVIADNGYNGLSSVNIITNIESGGDDELLNRAVVLVDKINGEVI